MSASSTQLTFLVMIARIQGIERIMRISPRAKTIRETEKVGLIDRIQYLNRGTLRRFYLPTQSLRVAVDGRQAWV